MNVLKPLPSPLYDEERDWKGKDRSISWLKDGQVLYGQHWTESEIRAHAKENEWSGVVLWSRGGNAVRRIFLDRQKRKK